MPKPKNLPVAASIWSYTAAVTARKLLTQACFVGALLVPAAGVAQTHNQTDAGRTFGQAARATADVADQAADSTIQPPSSDGAPADPLQASRDGVVVLERAGKPIGVGTVLAEDGRILTALSPLGHGNDVDARFVDGSVTRVRMGHTDRGWDLALLIPQNNRWKRGLKASKLSAAKAGSQLRAYSIVGNKSDVMLSRTLVKGKSTLLGADSALLRDALDLATRFKSTDLGSPIVDERGDVIAVVARACAPAQQEGPCTLVPFGVPMPAIKAFLRTVPANAVPPAPWLGIQGVSDTVGPVRGVRVLSVHPKSSAAAAGLHGGSDKASSDVVVAVDGVPVSSPESLAETINRRTVGDSVELLLFGGGKFRQVSLALRAAPDATEPKRSLRRSEKLRPRR
jgi:serine protease Do